MKAKIIFCTAVLAAILVVILLALISPVAHRKAGKNQANPLLALSLYIQQPRIGSPNPQPASAEPGALIFRHTLTQGPENTSGVVGNAQGFIIPVEHFAHSAFNIIYLTFETPEFSGSLSVQAKHVTNKGREELEVVGGTGSFAFARGLAVFAQADEQSTTIFDAMYHVRLRLEFPHRVKTFLG